MSEETTHEVQIVDKKPTSIMQMEDALHALELEEEFARRAKTIVLRLTNAKDWVDMGGRPYLQGTGAEKVAPVFGISWRICDGFPKKEFITDDAGTYYKYETKGEFSLRGRTIEATGTCSQRDKLLGTVKGAFKDASKVDEGSVIKKLMNQSSVFMNQWILLTYLQNTRDQSLATIQI